MRIRGLFVERAALVACVAAVAAPAASASFPDYDSNASGASRATSATYTAPPIVRPIVVRPSGFDWGDAAIGAGVAAAGFGVLAAGTQLVRRSRPNKLVVQG